MHWQSPATRHGDQTHTLAKPCSKTRPQIGSVHRQNHATRHGDLDALCSGRAMPRDMATGSTHWQSHATRHGMASSRRTYTCSTRQSPATSQGDRMHTLATPCIKIRRPVDECTQAELCNKTWWPRPAKARQRQRHAARPKTLWLKPSGRAMQQDMVTWTHSAQAKPCNKPRRCSNRMQVRTDITIHEVGVRES